MAVGNLATILGDTITLLSQACGPGQLSDDAWGHAITLPSQACGRGQLSDDAWGHTYVTVARCRKLVAVGNLATMLGDTITLPSQACGRGQLRDLATMLGDTITLPSQACGRGQLSDDAWGHDYVTIASLWPWATYRRCLGTRLRYHRKLVAVGNLATMLGDRITFCIASLWPWAT